MLVLAGQQLLNGLTVGGVYALMAVGLTLVYGILYQANFAHGEQYLIATYVLFVLLGLGVGYPIAAVVSIIAATILGYLFYRLIYKPTMEAPHEISVLSFFGASMIISYGVMIYFGPDPHVLSVPYFGEVWNLGGVTVTAGRVQSLVFSVLLLVAAHLFIQKTRIGTAMRAVAQDLPAAKLMGIDVGRIGMITFVLAGALAGVGAVLVAPLYGYVAPVGGFWTVIRAFAIIIIGGLGNVPGTIAGAFLLGIGESFLAGFVLSTLKDVFPWLLVITVLWLKPEGLFGKPIRRP